jgi:hypothetical protein
MYSIKLQKTGMVANVCNLSISEAEERELKIQGKSGLYKAGNSGRTRVGAIDQW